MPILFENSQRKYSTSEISVLIETLYEQTITLQPLAKTLQAQSVQPAVTVYYVSPAKIRQINAQTRQLDQVTDVLSFPMLELKSGRLLGKISNSDLTFDQQGTQLQLGDVVICLQRAQQQAKQYQHSFEREVGFLAVHGFLHLLGFDHDTPAREKEMQKYQRQILNGVGLTR